jgi:hypothetical protein
MIPLAAALPDWGLEEATLFFEAIRSRFREELAASSGEPASLHEELLVEAALGHLDRHTAGPPPPGACRACGGRRLGSGLLTVCSSSPV